MYNASSDFIAAMKDHPYIAKLTLDGTDVIEGDAIQEITFRSGANGNENAFTLGGAVSASVEMILHKDRISCALHGREVKVELGIDFGSHQEWIPMGVYYVTDPLSGDDLLTVTAYDALAAKFDVEYEELPGFAFGTGDGVSSTAFLQALGARRGVEVDVSNLAPIALKAPPDGFTERQIIGFIAALYGGFANIDRTGVLRIREYSECNVCVTADDYYEDGMEKADYDFSVQWIKCYNESTDLTMFVGDLDAQQGIYLESIWMDYTILNNLLDKLQGFSYRPVTELSFLGNPLIDPGDIITMEDLGGEIIKFPVMNISHEYDGGIITRITANGQAKTDDCASSTQREIRRASASAKRYTDSENEKLNQLELLKRLTKEWVDDGLYLTDYGKLGVHASAILVGVLKGIEIIGEKGTIGGFTMSDHTLSAVLRKDYPEFTQEDLEKLQRHTLFGEALTDEEIANYDLNLNGYLEVADASLMLQLIEGSRPNYSEGRITLDATSPSETIVLEFTSGLLAGRRLALGPGLIKTYGIHATSYYCDGDRGYTGEVAVGDKTFTIKGGIITGVS